MIFAGLAWKLIATAGAVIAVFFVAWHFYIHDHAARTTGGIEVSLGRAIPGHADAHCRDHGDGWRCTVRGRTYVVEPARKNCWRVREPKLDGCVKVLDYVAGFL